jgi:hypothetical protein
MLWFMMSAAPLSPADVSAVVAAVTALSIAFAFKHLLADFLMQTNWMARGKNLREGWWPPLLAHVLCHTALTLVIVLVLAPRLWWLAVVDFGIHATADRAKALVGQHGAWRVDQPRFWWLLGVDQFLHQVTNIGLAAAVVLL